jgi:FixJ family two-component response regulator
MPGPLVVVVEDDPGSRRTLARVLRAGGFDAAVYESAEDFLASPPTTLPVGMLLDINLGGLSGLELQHRLRSEGSRLPIIMITAYDEPHTRERAERLGCLAYLNKPCEPETIISLLRSLVSDTPSTGGTV